MQTQRDEQRDGPVVIPAATLTPAEQRVLDQVLIGRSTKEIAESLVLTEATIKSHLAHIYAKFGVRGRIDLLARSRDAQRQSPPDREKSPSQSSSGRVPGGAWLAYGSLPAILAGLLVLVIVGAWVAGLQGPRPISIDDLDDLISNQIVSELELTGSTLRVSTPSAVYEVSGVDVEQVRPVAAEKNIPFSQRSVGTSRPTGLLLLNGLPYITLISIVWIAAIAAVRWRLQRYPTA